MRYFIGSSMRSLPGIHGRLQFSPWERRHFAGEVGGEQQLAGRMPALPGAAMAAVRDRQPVDGEPLMIEVLNVSC